MAFPQDSPPETVGLDPLNASEVNMQVGTHLRTFVTTKETIAHDKDWLSGADLKVAPYLFTPDQETLIKTAIIQLDTALEAVDMTFINQLTGLF
jgi:hypothetical protein